MSRTCSTWCSTRRPTPGPPWWDSAIAQTGPTARPAPGAPNLPLTDAQKERLEEARVSLAATLEERRFALTVRLSNAYRELLATRLNDALDGTGAAAGRGIGAFALVEGVLFVVILFLGLAYVWAKGDLDWVLTYDNTPYQPRGDARRSRLPELAEIEAQREAADAPAESEEAEEPDEAAA